MSKRFSRARRDFLSGAASLSGTALMASTFGGMALSACRKPPNVPTVNERHKAVVIGSGFGGAIAAYHLSQKGVETVVIERGRRWNVSATGDTFPTWNSPDRRTAWLAGSTTFPLAPPAIFKPYVGLIERVKGRGLDIVCGAGVGGSSLVFGGMMLRPPQDLFERVMPAGLSYDEYDKIYYPRVKAMVGIGTIPDDILANDRYTSTRIFLDHANRAGYKGTKINDAFNWDVIRDELAGKVVASASIGEEIYGSNSGAKNSVDRNYLVHAENSGYVQIYAQHGVENIYEQAGPNGETQYLIETYQIDEGGNPTLKKMITADYLFVAAGSAGTNRLMAKAKGKGTLKHLNNQVGLNWGNNGDRLLVRYALGEKTLARQGCPASAAIFDHDNPMGPVTILHGPAPLTAESRVMALLGMGLPDGRGRFVYDASEDDGVLEWDPSNDRQSVAAIMSTVDHLNDVTGGSTMDMSWIGGNSTYHPLGGMVLGQATDMVGRVQNYKRLYVTDASLIPGTTGCCNPAWTVAATAERCMDHIIDEDFS